MISATIPMSISGCAGKAAEDVVYEIESSRAHLEDSNVFGFVKQTLQQINEIYKQWNYEGWDGERAKPVSKEAILYAKEFLASLPLGIEIPDVGADPDGAITLEWYRSPNRFISISVNPDGWYYFVSVDGTDRRKGSGFVLMGISEDEIVKLILAVAKNDY